MLAARTLDCFAVLAMTAGEGPHFHNLTVGGHPVLQLGSYTQSFNGAGNKLMPDGTFAAP
jgi:hypothetical protein